MGLHDCEFYSLQDLSFESYIQIYITIFTYNFIRTKILPSIHDKRLKYVDKKIWY